MTMSQERTRTAVAAFETRDQAERAVDALRSAGFNDEHIGWAQKHEEKPDGVADATKGAATGAVTGGVVGGVAAAAAMAFIPGVGPFIGGGMLATVLGSAGIGAAAGGLLGGLTGMGLDHDEATHYEGEFKSGRAIVTVNAGDRYTQAADILRECGGHSYSPGSAATTTR